MPYRTDAPWRQSAWRGNVADSARNSAAGPSFTGWFGGLIAGSEGREAWQMSIIGWLVLGLIAGFIASQIVNKSGEGVLMDIVLGIVGAVVGGFLFAQFGATGITGFNIYSMVVAVIGAVVVLFLYHALFGRRTTV
jgi:uncharacterized membrane protein YeaQ/YmgE (transglycosylase-associated protein family)